MNLPPSLPPNLGSQIPLRDDLHKVIACTLQLAHVSISALKALRATNSDMNREVALSVRRIAISDEFPMTSLMVFENIRSLTVRGDFDPKNSNRASLDRGRSQDDHLHHLLHLNQLAHLRIVHSDRFTDAGLCRVWKLHQLRSLSLRHCPNISGEGLNQLAHLSHLDAIDLG